MRILEKEKGNVFYDIRVSTVRKNGTLFDGQPITSIIKGKKFLERQASMESAVRLPLLEKRRYSGANGGVGILCVRCMILT